MHFIMQEPYPKRSGTSISSNRIFLSDHQKPFPTNPHRSYEIVYGNRRYIYPRIADRKCHGERSVAISIWHWNVHIVGSIGNFGVM